MTSRLVLLVALLLGIWVRWSFIDQPMRLDESFSFITFVNSTWSNVFLYPFPNNHVLNSILERISCALVGGSPLGIRLPAFVCGICLIAAAYGLARKLGNELSGALAGLGVAVWPYLILFSTNGRGYSLVALLVVVMAYAAVDESGQVQTSRVPLVALLSALAMLAIPSSLFAISGLVIWMTAVLAMQRHGWRSIAVELLAPFIAFFVVLTLIFYTPVALVSGGLEGVMSNKESNPLPPRLFFHQTPPHIALAIHWLAVDVPDIVVVMSFALAIYGCLVTWRRQNYAAALLFPAFVLGGVALFLLKRSIPFPRTWLFLISILLSAAGIGFSSLLVYVPRRFQHVSLGLVLAASIYLARAVVVRDAISQYPETGFARGAEQMAVAFSAIVMANDRVCGSLPGNGAIAYEMQRRLRGRTVEDNSAGERLFWLRLKPTRPTRGLQDGWQTVVETDDMIADAWTRTDMPAVVKDLDCWPVKALFNR